MVGNNYTSSQAATGAFSAAYDLMNYMAGSLNKISQWYFVNDPTATSWSDPTTSEGRVRYLKAKQREFSFFVKDDWKVNSDLTLNLGVRYEYYGVPWNLNGMTIGIVGGGNRLFGGHTGGFDTWLRGTVDGEVAPFDPDNTTDMHFIGPDSPNPDESLFNKDLNNWGPAVGFAWQLPWLGKGKTTLRGGYQISYSQISRLDPNGGMMAVAGSQPGVTYAHTYYGIRDSDPYLDLAQMSNYAPTSQFFNEYTPQPIKAHLITSGEGTAYAMDPDIRNPYIQSLTLALTRQVGSSLTVDVRYIGTLSRKGVTTVNLNEDNWLRNGLKEAFDSARTGGESALLNQLIPPGSLNFGGTGTGADQLRSYSGTSTMLAQGNYDGLANYLASTNGNYFGLPSGVNGELVRRSGLGENFIWTNRQFGTATYYLNRTSTNYHSMQAQVTLRPTHGLNFTSTYTWARTLGYNATSDPLDPRADYGIAGNHRAHQLTTYGTYNLPLGGPNGYLFRDSSGWVKRLAEGWQLSWVSSLSSGIPYSVSSLATMYGGSAVDLVRPDLFNPKDGHVTWDPDARNGYFFGERYVRVNDPTCDVVYNVAPPPAYPGQVTRSLQQICQDGFKALALADDPTTIVMQRAMPGRRGTFNNNQLTSPGRWSLDMAVSKDITIMEGKSINFRVDVNNILNHPTPSGSAPSSYDQRTYAAGAPDGSLTSTATPFGYIGYKVGHRVFSAKIRVSF